MLLYYRPQTKFAKVMFLQVCVCPQGDVHGAGGVHGAGRGVHGGRGACVVPGGMHGAGGHAWWQGVCGVAGGVHGGRRGCAWWWGGMGGGIRRDTVNERAVRILLECMLYLLFYYSVRFKEILNSMY